LPQTLRGQDFAAEENVFDFEEMLSLRKKWRSRKCFRRPQEPYSDALVRWRTAALFEGQGA